MDVEDNNSDVTYHPQNSLKARKKLRPDPTAIDSSDDEQNSKKKKCTGGSTAAPQDSDIEEVEDKKETAEEQLGKLSLMA